MFARGLRIAARRDIDVYLLRRSATAPDDNNSQSALAKAKPFEQVPGYRILPLIGTVWIYLPIIGKYSVKKMHDSDLGKYREHGDLVREKFGPLDVVICFRPEDIRSVLAQEGPFPHRPGLNSLRSYRELRKEWYQIPGLLVMQGKEWRLLRSKTQPHIMRPQFVQSYLTSMHEISKDMVQRILDIRDSKQEVQDLLPELYKWALESVAFVGLDTRLGCLENDLDPESESVKLINAVQIAFDCMSVMEYSGRLEWWIKLRTPKWKAFVEASDVFSMTALKYVTQAMAALKNNTDEGKDRTLLQILLSTEGLAVSGAMTMVMDMIMAGIDTTSHTMGFILYHLAKNPDKQEKLHDEIKQVLASTSGQLSTSAVNELRYLKSCMKEAIRLHPVSRGTARILDHDIVLNGYRIPSGVGIFLGIQAVCRLEKYFKNADQFIPERWLDKANKPNPFLFLPFGHGARSCIGRRLAEQEIICLTVEIIKKFRVEYHYKDIDLFTRLVNVPDKPLRYRFIDRL